MRKAVFVIGLIAGSALLATTGFALEFSSKMVMTSQEQVHGSKIYMKDQKSRTNPGRSPATTSHAWTRT